MLFLSSWILIRRKPLFSDYAVIWQQWISNVKLEIKGPLRGKSENAHLSKSFIWFFMLKSTLQKWFIAWNLGQALHKQALCYVQFSDWLGLFLVIRIISCMLLVMQTWQLFWFLLQETKEHKLLTNYSSTTDYYLNILFCKKKSLLIS